MDHLDYIKISGLYGSESEVFEGKGGDVIVEAQNAADEQPESLSEDLLNALETVWDWLTGQQPEPEEGTRGTRALPAILLTGLPVVLKQLTPVLIKKAAEETVAVTIQQIITRIFDALDGGESPGVELKKLRELLKKAFIWEDGLFQVDRSILKTAFLEEDDGKVVSILADKLGALKYNDEEIELPGNIRLHLRGKIISYPGTSEM